MISSERIRQQCPSKTFQRAQQIVDSTQNILTKRCRFDQDGTHLNAFVASSTGWSDSYRTSVLLDEATGSILDYSCTCPAIQRYDGPCKHCVALALSYVQRPDHFAGYKADRAPETSPCLAEFIKRDSEASLVAVKDAIDIEPTFVYAYRTWSVHFKVIGPHGSYVVKNITEFAERIEQGAHYAYGKKLEFRHTLDAFTKQSRTIAALIVRAVMSRKRTAPIRAWGSRSQDLPSRTIGLTEYEIIDLLDALGSRTFVIEGGDFGVRSTTTAHIVHENPDIALRLIKEAQGGFSVARDEPIVFITCGNRMFVWLDDIFYDCDDDFAESAAFLKAVYDSEVDHPYLSEADLPLFCAATLPRIESSIRVQAPAELDDFRPVPGVLEFYFDKTPKRVTCDVYARYETQRRHFRLSHWYWDEDNAKTPLPDELLERSATTLIGEYLGDGHPTGAGHVASACLDLASSNAVGRLLFEGLKRFEETGTVYTTPAFDRLISDKKPRITMGVSLSGNLIDLDVRATDLPAEELGSLLASYRLRKRYHRLKSGAFLDIAQLDLAQLDRIASDLDISGAQLAQGVIELPAYRAFYLDDELHDAERDGNFTSYIEQFNPSDLRAYEIPSSLNATLRPYQKDGFMWMNALCDMNFGGVLADEMGLGKSVQFISFLLSRLDEIRAGKPALIVCPASLVYNWIGEFSRFAPEMRVEAIVGTKSERAALRHKAGTDVFVTSYDLLRIDIKDYLEQEFFCQMLDEAQYIKNHGTLTARAVKRVNACHRFALTGTPVENRLSEIWSIFDFLMPGFLGSYMRFRERFELDIVGGDEDAAERLQKLIGPFMLRRLKSDVLPDLPEKIEGAVLVQMTPKQARLYAAHEQRLRESLTAQHARKNASEESAAPAVEVLAELTRLRQICCDPRLLVENFDGCGAKLDAIADLIESARNDNQKTLVFSQFTSFLDLIAERLDQQGIAYYTIKGTTPKKQRVTMVEQFNEDDTPVFLVSLKAGGTGLNLTGASTVIHADPWWNAAAQNQATDRAHRIGQKNVVNVYKVIARETIEERILLLQESKADLADKIIGAQGMSLSSLSKEELADLLCN